MRLTTTLTALLLGTTLLAPTGQANAVGETCRGEAATIVGNGYGLKGTPGRDVIVFGGLYGSVPYTGPPRIDSYGGDDLICVTGTIERVTVYAGTGDDIVDATTYRGGEFEDGGLSADLDAGADTFYGSVNADYITTGYFDPRFGAGDNERDVIDTGGGDDSVYGSGQGGTVPNNDILALGTGSDSVFARGPLAVDGRIDGGDGTDRLGFDVTTGALSVDAAQQTAALDRTEWLRWSAMEEFRLEDGSVDVDFVGTSDDDRLTVYGQTGSRTVDMAGGGGDDYLLVKGQNDTVVNMDAGDGDDSLTVSTELGNSSVDADMGRGEDDVTLLTSSRTPFGPNAILGGPGQDTVTLAAELAIKVDLSKGTLGWGGMTSTVDGVENASAFGSSAILSGDRRRNVLFGGMCTLRVAGRGGHDRLSFTVLQPLDHNSIDCRKAKPRTTFLGGGGNDVIHAYRNRDILYGGRGNDKLIGKDDRGVAVGGPGRDKCLTNVEKSCER